MTVLNIAQMDHKVINEQLRAIDGDVHITGCCGQRFIGAGFATRSIRIDGVPGNALGAYLNGAEIEVFGNAQDAVGDTMNNGKIVVHGSIGDTAGYAMRGGEIFVEGDAGYRTGIHMKAYKDKLPVIVIGGCAGSFLGEYQAGGIIAVLGLNAGNRPLVSNFPCAGMHGGKLFLRCSGEGIRFPAQVRVRSATAEDMAELAPHAAEFARLFHQDYDKLMDADFTVVVPDSNNPYRQMYVAN